MLLDDILMRLRRALPHCLTSTRCPSFLGSVLVATPVAHMSSKTRMDPGLIPREAVSFSFRVNCYQLVIGQTVTCIHVLGVKDFL